MQSSQHTVSGVQDIQLETYNIIKAFQNLIVGYESFLLCSSSCGSAEFSALKHDIQEDFQTYIKEVIPFLDHMFQKFDTDFRRYEEVEDVEQFIEYSKDFTQDIEELMKQAEVAKQIHKLVLEQAVKKELLTTKVLDKTETNKNLIQEILNRYKENDTLVQNILQNTQTAPQQSEIQINQPLLHIVKFFSSHHSHNDLQNNLKEGIKSGDQKLLCYKQIVEVMTPSYANIYLHIEEIYHILSIIHHDLADKKKIENAFKTILKNVNAIKKGCTQISNTCELAESYYKSNVVQPAAPNQWYTEQKNSINDTVNLAEGISKIIKQSKDRINRYATAYLSKKQQ